MYVICAKYGKISVTYPSPPPLVLFILHWVHFEAFSSLLAPCFVVLILYNS